MISATDFKRGMWIEHDESPWLVLDVHKQMPSARGASMLVKVRLRNPQTGNVQDITFKGSDKVNEPQVEQRPVQYLYSDTSGLHFMDQESYEQFSLTREELGELTGFMIESMEAKALILDGRVLGIELPAHDAEPAPTPAPAAEFREAMGAEEGVQLRATLRLLEDADDVAAGSLAPSAIDEQAIASRLYTAGLADPDLLLRTAGEMRISNFLLWQISYAELWVTERSWPEFEIADLHQAIRDFARRDRRFGGLADQSEPLA